MMGVPFYRTYMQRFAAVMQVHDRLWGKCTDRGSIDLLSCLMPTP
jgi:hypothetical protein